MKHLAVAFAILAVSAPAFAAAASPVVTKFERGDQVVKLMAHVGPLKDLMNEKVDGKALRRNLPAAFLGGPIFSFWARPRIIDGKQMCEKFAVVLAGWSEDKVAAYADRMFREPC